MDFTREPIIETIITPKDGCKLVVRSSKGAGQEEYFVDAVEVVTFGNAHFFRSLERPKSFLVPVVDYEIIEVREARMVLKNLGPDRSIKIGGGRESGSKGSRESEKAVVHPILEEEPVQVAEQEEVSVEEVAAEGRPDVRVDKKRDRRRHYRRRRNGKEEGDKEGDSSQIASLPPLEDEGKVDISPPEVDVENGDKAANTPISSQLLLLQPPPLLISDTIKRYRDHDLFKKAFFVFEDEQYKPHDKAEDLLNDDEDEQGFSVHLKEPIYESQLESGEASSVLNEEEKENKEEEKEDTDADKANNSTLEDLPKEDLLSKHEYEQGDFFDSKVDFSSEEVEEKSLDESTQPALSLYEEESLDGTTKQEDDLFPPDDVSLRMHHGDKEHDNHDSQVNSLPSE